MRQITLYLLSIVLFTFMSSCHDEESGNISWSQEASVLIKQGISSTHEKTEVVLKFTTINSDISVSSDEAWIGASISLVGGNGELLINISENPDISSRQGIVVVSSKDETTIIHITQEGIHRVVPENNCYYLHNGKGEMSVKVQAGSLPVAEIYPENTDWIKVEKVTAANDNEYIIILTFEKNDGLGRIASLDFKINDQSAVDNCGPCIIQEPASLGENVEISVDKPDVFRFF